MKLLFDQNLAHRAGSALESLYPGSKHVMELEMETASDEEIWNYARDNEMTIVSKDSDFYYRSMLLGHPPKVIWIRLGNCTTAQVIELLRSREDDLREFDADSNASFLILP